MSNALDVQIDGDHYKKMKLQPVELTYLVGGTPCFCKLAKYGSRVKVDRLIDLNKALHCISIEEEVSVKLPGVIETNYPVPNDFQRSLAKAFINIFTDDNNLRIALTSMHDRNYTLAKKAINNLIKSLGE